MQNEHLRSCVDVQISNLFSRISSVWFRGTAFPSVMAGFVFCVFSSGYLHKEEVWSDEKGLRAERTMWLWDSPHHFQQLQQTVPVRQHRHGQSVTEIHRVQRTPWEQNQLGHRRGEWAPPSYKYTLWWKKTFLWFNCAQIFSHLM